MQRQCGWGIQSLESDGSVKSHSRRSVTMPDIATLIIHQKANKLKVDIAAADVHSVFCHGASASWSPPGRHQQPSKLARLHDKNAMANNIYTHARQEKT